MEAFRVRMNRVPLRSKFTFWRFVVIPVRAIHATFSRHFLGRYFSVSSGCESFSTPTLSDLSNKKCALPSPTSHGGGGHAQRMKPDLNSSTVEYDRVKTKNINKKATVTMKRHADH